MNIEKGCKISFSDSNSLVELFNIEKIRATVDNLYPLSIYSDICTGHERENYHRYIRIMAELDWPAYINDDPIFHEYVIEEYDQHGESGVIKAIYDFYDPVYLKSLETQIATSNVIKPERLPLFHEAFLLYQLGYYYGSVSILIPQLVGITSDIEKYLKKNDSGYDSKTVELIKKRYGLQHTNDMSRIMTAVLEGKAIDEDEGEYGFFLGYLRFKIFKSHLSNTDTLKHPNRNSICHGTQLNYGTKEHALKTILCIDALVWISEVIATDIAETT